MQLNEKVAVKAQRFFTTGISLITSFGPHGQNVMAAEWTMQISYRPMLIAIFVHEGNATYENIKKTKEFGVNVASEGQTKPVNVAGGYSQREIDKLRIKDTFEKIPSKVIKSPMLRGCIVNAECKLVKMTKFGDHVMIVGKVAAISYDETKKPLIYHLGKYFQIGSAIEPFRKIVNVDKQTFDWFVREVNGKFVLKVAGLIITQKNSVLVVEHISKNNSYLTIPYTVPKKGQDYTKTINFYLELLGITVNITKSPKLERLALRYKKNMIRINFVLFEGKLESNLNEVSWKTKLSNSLLRTLIN